MRHRTPPVLRRFARALEHLVVALESTDVDAVREAQIAEALHHARPLLRAYRAGAFREDALSVSTDSTSVVP